MPIERTIIPQLIKTSEVKKLERWKTEYFEKIAKQLQVHTKGQLFSKVDTVFPNESPESKAHCLATYEPITKGSIWKGINNLLRIFSSSSFSFQVGDELNKWLAEYEYNGQNLLNHFLQEWINNAVAEDPNGLFVVYPIDWAEEHKMCPIQWVRSELIKSQTSELVSFVSENDSEVEYYYETHTTKREVFYDPSIEAMNGISSTQVTYNQRLRVKVVKEVVHLFTKEGFIIYSKLKGKDFETTIVDFAEPVTQIPVFPGGGFVADKADQLLFESFVQPFVPFGNLALLQHRNHRAVDLMFSYPRMSELQVPCDHKGCAAGVVKCKTSSTYPDGRMPCPSCKGKSFITVQSPYKVYTPRYDPNDANDNKHLQVEAVKFHSPDTGIINYSKDAWQNYLRMAEVAIFITQKHQTGQVQSEGSKEIDLDDLYAWLLNVSRVFYNNLRMMLQSLENYVSRSPVTVSVERPFSFAILTEAEAFLAMNGILTSDAPIFIKGNQVENFVSKFISKDSPIIRALEILKQYDPLLFYSLNEVQQFKGSNVVGQEMYTKHVLAYPVLLKLYMLDKNILFQNDDVIMAAMDKEIEAMKVPDAVEGFRASVLGQLEGAESPTSALRSSVGGLTGMIEIVKAVASGVYSREAAAKLIADRFGITEEEALEQLGNPTVNADEVEKVVKLT
jgi:hypothetical protein